jgi:hypothetical protein
MTKNKVDLTILKRLVAELESTLNTAEGIQTDVAPDKAEYSVEVNKATGLAAGVMMESALLMGEIQALLQGLSAPSSKLDFLEKILGGFKGPGNSN